jgi:hypothetical protein
MCGKLVLGDAWAQLASQAVDLEVRHGGTERPCDGSGDVLLGAELGGSGNQLEYLGCFLGCFRKLFAVRRSQEIPKGGQTLHVRQGAIDGSGRQDTGVFCIKQWLHQV